MTTAAASKSEEKPIKKQNKKKKKLSFADDHGQPLFTGEIYSSLVNQLQFRWSKISVVEIENTT